MLSTDTLSNNTPSQVKPFSKWAKWEIYNPVKIPDEPKRKLVKKPEFEIKATSSKELSDIEDSHSTDDANSTVADVRNTIEKGRIFVKTEHFYVAGIIDVKEHYSVKFLKNIAHSNKFLYDKEETYEIDNRNIVFKLPSHNLLVLQSDNACSSLL
ncbi:hypothetical protein TNCV_2829301 [Trichonephila clavipes]|nr:hypothetical protein TNCV_2829301 [Trichonephila clavipes]